MQMRSVVGASSRKGGSSRGARPLSLPVGLGCLRSDEGGYKCLPAGLAIALTHQLARFLLGAFSSQFAGRWARPTAMGIMPTRSQRDDDDEDEDDDDDGGGARGR